MFSIPFLSHDADLRAADDLLDAIVNAAARHALRGATTL
jgi:hypothetical protein